MKQLNALVLGLGMWAMGATVASAQCPNCTISLPLDVVAIVDTMHLDSFPNGQKNAYYEENLSFRLPQSTDPVNAVDPTVPAGIGINSITITNISGFPSGLSYKLDRDPGLYNETAPVARDGCVNVCGTPAQSGTFDVLIDVLINVQILGDVPYQIPLVFVVDPDTNAAFNTVIPTGCDTLLVEFENQVASNGDPRVSYSWDFGNGETSTDENPAPVMYTTGSYGINYQCIIDTFPYNLRRVIVTSTTCNDDVFPITTNAPDLYLVLKDGTNTEIINNDPNTTPVIGTAPDQYPPDTVWTGVQALNLADTYTIEIWDDDNDVLNADDACGVFSFTANTTQTVFTNGGYAIEIWIEHYIDTIDYTDSVHVEACPPVGVEQLSPLDKGLSVYPNPSKGTVNVAFSMPQTNDAQLQITDMLGRVLFSRQLGNFSGDFNEAFDFQNYGTGMYLLNLRVGNEMLHRKIVIR